LTGAKLAISQSSHASLGSKLKERTVDFLWRFRPDLFSSSRDSWQDWPWGRDSDPSSGFQRPDHLWRVSALY